MSFVMFYLMGLATATAFILVWSIGAIADRLREIRDVLREMRDKQ